MFNNSQVGSNDHSGMFWEGYYTGLYNREPACTYPVGSEAFEDFQNGYKFGNTHVDC